MNAGQTTWKQGPSHRLLASFSPCLLTDSALTQNAYIMRTKCAQKRECDIFNSSVTITYNFSTLKCTHFPVCDLNLNRSLNLNPTAPSNSCQFVLIRVSNSKLTETDRFRPKLPGGYYTNKPTYLRSAGFQPAVSRTSSLQLQRHSTLNPQPRSYELKTRPFPDRPRPEFLEFSQEIIKTRP